MATITDPGFPTLQNILKRLRPNGSVEGDMVNLMSTKKPTLEDMPWVEANGPDGHRVTAALGAPPPSWRKYNEGVKPTKGESVQWDESCGMVEDYSDIDLALAERNGNRAAFRESEDKIKLEAFAKEVVRAVFYENATTAPERLHGLAARYTGESGSQTEDYVLKKGTRSGSNCESIYLINWDPDTVFGIYPKASVAGVHHRDLGERTLTRPDGTQLQVLTTHFKQQAGLCVRDYRRVVRAQWDPDDATFADSAKSMYLLLQEMMDVVHDLGPNARFYMSRKSRAKLNAQLASNSANFLEYISLNGRRVPAFMECPIRIEDTLVPETALV